MELIIFWFWESSVFTVLSCYSVDELYKVYGLDELDELRFISAISVKFKSFFYEVDIKSDETELSVLSICFTSESWERRRVISPITKRLSCTDFEWFNSYSLTFKNWSINSCI
jgi:hypothetical protein